jgi:hypothetical protein
MLAIVVPAGVADALITIDPGHHVGQAGSVIEVPILISSFPTEQVDAIQL